MRIEKHNQQGITFISLMLLLTIAGFFALLVLKLGPIYLENYTVKTVLANMRKDPTIHLQPPRRIRQAIDDQLYINEVRRLSGKDIKLRREDKAVIVEIEYEVREHIMANVDAVMSFKESARLDGS